MIQFSEPRLTRSFFPLASFVLLEEFPPYYSHSNLSNKRKQRNARTHIHTPHTHTATKKEEKKVSELRSSKVTERNTNKRRVFLLLVDWDVSDNRILFIRNFTTQPRTYSSSFLLFSSFSPHPIHQLTPRKLR